MKKQTDILTTTAVIPAAKKMELIFLLVIAAIFYRNQSNRRLPNMPPNSLGLAKQALQSVVSESEKMVNKLANFFYNVTGESLMSIFRFVAVVGIIAFVAAAVVYIIRTH